MALKVLNTSGPPLGRFDCLDAELSSFKGGEVCALTSTTYQGTDLTAQTTDGYTGTSSKTRPVVTLTMDGTDGRLFLADDGTAGYGQLFGQLVGGTAGQIVNTGSQLGPHSASGSGKITLHYSAGLYGVTLDAVDSSIDPSGALTVGAALSYTAAGLLCATGSKVGSAPTVANFVEFGTNGSLVNTPNSLVSALNSPSGSVASSQANRFTMAVINWFATTS